MYIYISHASSPKDIESGVEGARRKSLVAGLLSKETTSFVLMILAEILLFTKTTCPNTSRSSMLCGMIHTFRQQVSLPWSQMVISSTPDYSPAMNDRRGLSGRAKRKARIFTKSQRPLGQPRQRRNTPVAHVVSVLAKRLCLFLGEREGSISRWMALNGGSLHRSSWR